jgi:uncharacterized protein (TIGR02646 family)
MRKITKNPNNPVDVAAAAASIRNSLSAKAQTALVNLSAPNALCSKDIDGDIYASDAVKHQLKTDQFNKCAYCERFFNGDYGAVEHYRPKARYQDALHTPRQLGYWWLAYDWNNLLYSCSECNTSFKGCLFPLKNPAQRNIAGQSIINEEPLIINPASMDPKHHIVFKEDVVMGITDEGRATISIFELNDRPQIKDLRRKKWVYFKRDYDKIKELEKLIDVSEHQTNMPLFCVNELKRILNGMKVDIQTKYLNEDNEYAGMFENQLSPIIL